MSATRRVTVTVPGQPPVVVDADEVTREGAWLVLRAGTTVMGRPRRYVVLRVPAAGTTVTPA